MNETINYNDLFNGNPINLLLLSIAWDDLNFKEKIRILEIINEDDHEEPMRPRIFDAYILKKAHEDKNPLIKAIFQEEICNYEFLKEEIIIDLYKKTKYKKINHFSNIKEIVNLPLIEQMMLLNNSSLNEAVVTFFQELVKIKLIEKIQTTIYPLFYSWITSKSFNSNIDHIVADNEGYLAFNGLNWQLTNKEYKSVWHLLELNNEPLSEAIFLSFPIISENINEKAETVKMIFDYLEKPTSCSHSFRFFSKTKGFFTTEKKELFKKKKFWQTLDGIKFSEEELNKIEEPERREIKLMQEEHLLKKRSDESMKKFFKNKNLKNLNKD